MGREYSRDHIERYRPDKLGERYNGLWEGVGNDEKGANGWFSNGRVFVSCNESTRTTIHTTADGRTWNEITNAPDDTVMATYHLLFTTNCQLSLDDGVTWTAGFEPLDGVTTCCYRGQSWPSSKGVNLVCDDDGVGHVVVNGVDIDPNPIISYNDLIDRPIVDGKLQYSFDGTDQGIKNLRTLTGWDAELATLRIKSNGGDMPFHIFSSSHGSAGFGTKDANEGRGSYAMSFHIDPDATISDNDHRIIIESKKLEVRPITTTIISGHGVTMTGSVSQQNAVMVLNHYKNEMGVNETFTPFMEIAGRENGASTIKYLFGDSNGQFMTTSFIDEASG